MKNYISHFFFCFALLSFSPLTWSQLNVSVSASAAGICTGQTTTLTATPSTGGGTYLWTPGNYTTQSINVSPTATVNYSVTYTLFGNSTTSAGTLITVNSTPTLNLAGPTQICSAQTACLTASFVANSIFLITGKLCWLTYLSITNLVPEPISL